MTSRERSNGDKGDPAMIPFQAKPHCKQQQRGPFSRKVTNPPSKSAKVRLPAVAHGRITASGRLLKPQDDGGDSAMQLGSGAYRLQVE